EVVRDEWADVIIGPVASDPKSPRGAVGRPHKCATVDSDGVEHPLHRQQIWSAGPRVHLIDNHGPTRVKALGPIEPPQGGHELDRRGGRVSPYSDLVSDLARDVRKAGNSSQVVADPGRAVGREQPCKTSDSAMRRLGNLAGLRMIRVALTECVDAA